MPAASLLLRQTFSPGKDFKLKALSWAASHPYCSYYTSNEIPYPQGAFPELLAVGTTKVWQLGNNPFDALYQIQQEQKNWLMGYFTYELKNKIHDLQSNNPAFLAFPACTFYQPDCILLFRNDEVEIQSHTLSPEGIFAQIEASSPPVIAAISNKVELRFHMSRKDYLKKVAAIKEHIAAGDCYELNLCQEFSATGIKLDPLALFLLLNKVSPAPFASFQRFSDHYLLCASPERFLKKEGKKLLSQPIKGTIRRGKTPEEDMKLQHQLQNDEKERAENMMIVDLVRNDLARSSVPGSVVVDEMFGIYSFSHVHQMISTVSSKIRPAVPFTEAIRQAFPMGSMTGAPKKKVMELIDQYENNQRGLYSGAVGFITPSGDFDFNVVIRSMLYNTTQQKLSFQVGSAITYDSEPEKEYEECLLKAKGIMQILGLETLS